MKTTTKLTADMLEALRAIAAHEAAGWIGAPVDSIPTRTRLALTRRDLIEPTVDGSRRLTAKGRKVIG